MGYGIIHIKNNSMNLIAMGSVNLTRYDNQALKLKRIYESITNLIDGYHPEELAIEAPFYGKNVQSMLKLGRAQGVAISACLNKEIPFTEYAPKKIKQSITGNGNASKEQVAKMLQTLLKIDKLPKKLDATDGLAAAVCHHFQKGISTNSKSYSGWKSFINQNPDRKK